MLGGRTDDIVVDYTEEVEQSQRNCGVFITTQIYIYASVMLESRKVPFKQLGDSTGIRMRLL